jgi:(E)-4-hydroxy-3-methylbut-2-enyl-diphosphate synthase
VSYPIPLEKVGALDIPRRATRRVMVGSVPIGGGAPVSVQSMTNTPTSDPQATLEQIAELASEGCEIVRIAVPDMGSLPGFAEAVAGSPIPVVADVQFSAELAVRAIEAGAAKVRVNPGNIGGPQKVRRVADAARAAGIPIRVGVNAGSLSEEMRSKHGGATVEAMVESALAEIQVLEDAGFGDIVVAAKASDVWRTIRACRRLADATDCPQHLGVTEAGLPRSGLVRSAFALGALLAEGIGDTLRVSLTAPPVEEVRAGWEILSSLRLRQRGPAIIACPTCSRCGIDLLDLAQRVADALATCTLPITVAVMGCIVNGPGEACEADVGVCAEKGGGAITRRGEVVRRVGESEILDALLREIDSLAAENSRADADHKEGAGT